MVRLSDMEPGMAKHLLELPCPRFEDQPWAGGPPLKKRRVALITTAGLHQRDDRHFSPTTSSYRVIPGRIEANKLVMSHASSNFDRIGFQEDFNVIFPLDRLRELARDGFIDSAADYHYSFMGAIDPTRMETAARRLAGLLKADGVNAVVLTPV